MNMGIIKHFNGSFHVEIMQGEIDSVLRCYSYDTLILQRHYRFYKLRDELTVYDMAFYSKTTRRHQGIARALDAYFSAHEGNTCEMADMVARSRSLRDLVRNFGYISINK